jgi:predicted DNA-binding transcriptional regulator AlpA
MSAVTPLHSGGARASGLGRSDMPSRVILVGHTEIAERLGVSRKAVERWRALGDVGFPEPEWMVSGSPIWRWSTIERWSRKTGYPKPMFNAKEES